MSLKNNIWKFGIYSFIDHIRLIWMITTLYLLGLGFSFTNIGLHETIFALVIVLFELPTGALADLIGRRKTLIISCILHGIGFTAIGLMSLPVHYYMIALIMGIAWSFVSGADVALLYDSVKKLNRTKDYKKIRGKINAFNQFALIIGVFLGPFLFTINHRLGFLVTGIVYLAAAVIVYSMVEPYKPRRKISIKAHWHQTLKGFTFTITHKQVMWLIGFFFLSTVGIEFFFDFWQQPLMVSNGIEIKYFGIILACMMGVRGLVSWFTHTIEAKLKENWSIILILVAHIVAYYLLSLGTVYILLFSFVLIYGAIAFQEIIFEDYVNRHISSANRATVLSVKSLIYNLFTAGMYVSIGMLIDVYSINHTLIGTSIVILVGTIILFACGRCTRQHVSV